MQLNWADRRLVAFSAAVFFICSCQPVLAQKTGSTPGAGTSGTTGGSIGRGNIGSIPSTGRSVTSDGSTATPGMNRPIFLSGKVVFDDGTPPNTDIRIERVCSGNPRLETHTDSKGRFSFQLGQNIGVDTDAADSSFPTGFGRPSGSSSSTGMGGFGPAGSAGNLWNCELRAAYPGFRSDVVELATRRALDDPNVGTIVLHRLGAVQGTTISVTTALAPKRAQKDYEKAMQLSQKGKYEEAETRLAEATDLYPKYAIAWFALGQVQQREGKLKDARKSFEAAIAADSKYVSPYDQLALLSAQGEKWEDAANYSKRAIQLNPVEFPSSFWYNAIANYNLKKPAEAEKSVKELLKLDTQHHFPEAENMLAQLELDRGNYAQAATHLRAYLAMAPNAKNAESVKQILSKIDPANAEAKK